MPPRKKRKITPETEPEPEPEPSGEEPSQKSPVVILNDISDRLDELTQAINRVIERQDTQQTGVYEVVERIASSISEQTIVMTDFASQVRSMKVKTNVWDNLAEVLFQMQHKKLEDEHEVRVFRKETRATAKALLHDIDNLRNRLIDLKHIWKVE